MKELSEREFFTAAKDHGFTDNQAGFLVKFVSRKPHTHTSDQIEDLEETVSEMIEDANYEG